MITMYMHRLLLLGTVLLIVACATPALPPPADGMVREAQRVDDMTIMLDMGAEPRANMPQSFVIRLQDGHGTLITNADVYLDLRCLSLCAPNRPIADVVGDGMYVAETVYTMDGDWRITVIASIDGQEYRAAFATSVHE